MQTLIVIIIVALAAWYVGRHLWRGLRPSPQSACGCSGGCGGCAAQAPTADSGVTEAARQDCDRTPKPPGRDLSGQ